MPCNPQHCSAGSGACPGRAHRARGCARSRHLPCTPGGTGLEPSTLRADRLRAPRSRARRRAGTRSPGPSPARGPDPAVPPAVPQRAVPAAGIRAASFPTAPAGIYSFPGAVSGCRFFIFVSFPPRRSPTSPRRRSGAGSWGRRDWPGPGAALLCRHQDGQCPPGPSRSTRPGQGETLPFRSDSWGAASPRRSPERGSCPLPPGQWDSQTCPGWGAGLGAARAPHWASAPRARLPRRAPDPNRRGPTKGQSRRDSAPRPRGDLGPTAPAGAPGGWKGREPRPARREGRSPGHSPWKSESLGTSIPALIQCSSGKEPATAAFRCSAPGGGRWGMPV